MVLILCLGRKALRALHYVLATYSLQLDFAQTYIHRGNLYCIISNNCCQLLPYPNQICTLLSGKVREGGRSKQAIRHRGDIYCKHSKNAFSDNLTS
jgi:hypothetical protein